jgi:hypothetical protein
MANGEPPKAIVVREISDPRRNNFVEPTESKTW